MTYITTAERIGIEKGRAEGHAEGRAEGRAEGHTEGLHDGLIEGIAALLEVKFGDASAPLLAQIRQVRDLARLQTILTQIKSASALDEVRALLAPDLPTD